MIKDYAGNKLWMISVRIMMVFITAFSTTTASTAIYLFKKVVKSEQEIEIIKSSMAMYIQQIEKREEMQEKRIEKNFESIDSKLTLLLQRR